jgi:hypothetical protein
MYLAIDILSDVRTYIGVYIHLVENYVVILMYPVLNLTHMLNILDKFSVGVTIHNVSLI